MSDPILPFAVWEEGTLQNDVPANDNSLRNEILNRRIISESITAQPGSPSDGDIYILAATHTGAQWAGFSQYDLTIYRGGTWYAYAPVNGIVVNVNGTLRRWTGSAYADAVSASVRNTVSALGTTGSVAIDYALGDYFTVGLTGNVTALTFSNLPGAGKGVSLMVRITQDTTPRTMAWPASFKWASGVAPAISTASGAVDVLAITTFDNGTTWAATLAKGFA